VDVQGWLSPILVSLTNAFKSVKPWTPSGYGLLVTSVLSADLTVKLIIIRHPADYANPDIIKLAGVEAKNARFAILKIRL